jgi:hypothetical protein
MSCSCGANENLNRRGKGRWECKLCRRKRLLREGYGITVEEFKRQFEEQDGLCACCGKRLELVIDDYRANDMAVVDHDHETGALRGILCAACNLGIGKLGDTLTSVENAVRYLSEFSWHTEWEQMPLDFVLLEA